MHFKVIIVLARFYCRRVVVKIEKKKIAGWVGLVLLVVCVAGTAWYFLRNFSERNYSFDIGTMYRYHIIYDSSSAAAFMSSSDTSTVSGVTKAVFDYTLTPFVEKKNGWLVSIKIGPVEKFSFIYNGEELFNDRSITDHIFSSRMAVFELSRSGEIGQIFFAPKEDVVFQGTIKMVLGDIQAALVEKSASWNKSEKDQYGNYIATYDIRAENEEIIDIRKSITEYTSVIPVKIPLQEIEQKNNSEIQIRWEKAGHMGTMSGKKNLLVIGRKNHQQLFTLETAFTCSFTDAIKASDDHSKLKDLTASWGASAMGTIAIDEAAKRKILEKREQNMTNEEMSSLLRSYSQTGEMYEKGAFLWRVTAHLELHPEDTKVLEKLFEEDSFNNNGRIFVLGILASVDNSEAQASMRKILDSKAAKEDRFYPVYVQQTIFLKNPDEKTVAFVETFYQQASAMKKFENAAAFMIGGVAGKLRKSGNETVAIRLNNQLLSALSQAKTDAEKERFLDAMGNSGFSSNVAVASEYLKADDARVRASVANAIRYVQTPESEKILFDLIADKDPTVKMNAINTLSEYKPSGSMLSQIQTYVADGTIPADNYLGLVQVLSGYGTGNTNVRKILETMQKKAFHNSEVRTKLNSILKGGS